MPVVVVSAVSPLALAAIVDMPSGHLYLATFMYSISCLNLTSGERRGKALLNITNVHVKH